MHSRRSCRVVGADRPGGAAGTAELEELFQLVDFRIARVKATYEAATADVIGKDPSWPVQWALLTQRYDATQQQVRAEVKPGDDVTDQYNLVLASVQKEPAHVSPGDLSDLMNRLGKAGHPVDESGTPQPKYVSLSDAFERYTRSVPTPSDLGKLVDVLKVAGLLWLLRELGAFK